MRLVRITDAYLYSACGFLCLCLDGLILGLLRYAFEFCVGVFDLNIHESAALFRL